VSTAAEPTRSVPAGAPALAELKVVEFGGFAAGPAVGKHLADHGAEVIHVESRLRLDGFRTNYPPYAGNRPGLERAAMFAITNNDKLGVTLNLKSPRAHDVARRLIERADVVVENFTPGTMERLGLGHDAMSERNPGLITLSTCNQGATGPHAGRAGFGTHLTALSGFTHLTGWPDRAPALLWGPFIDYIAVAYGAVAVLAALDERSRTGRGCHVDLSQYEAGVQFVAPVLATWYSSGEVLERAGNRHVTAVPHAVFPCAGEERWCAISVHDDEEWRRLRAALGDPGWAADPALDGAEGRRAAEAMLEERIAEWTRARPREEVVTALRAAGVHVAPVNDMRDLFADEQLVHRRAFRPLEHPEMGRHSVPGPSFVLPETPDRVESAAPLLGQHNREVLRGILGLGEDEVARLEAEGALE
jgi:crotonobetainyl-CoA:carnitine CoA-transferase CaiB-like acyl-CoA transferase